MEAIDWENMSHKRMLEELAAGLQERDNRLEALQALTAPVADSEGAEAAPKKARAKTVVKPDVNGNFPSRAEQMRMTGNSPTAGAAE